MSMHESDSEDTTIYRVVVNPEEQYSIWPAHREPPAGWKDTGKRGPKAECLAHIKGVWTDMRPLSLRRKMAEMEAKSQEPETEPSEARGTAERQDDLVSRLSAGQQPVELILRTNRTPKGLLERVRTGYVNIKFTNTRGGTELGVALDADALRKEQADLELGKGTVHLEGQLTLNGQKVRCIADIDIATFKGQGQLERVQA